MKGAVAIAGIFRREGVNTLFAYPGNGVIENAAKFGIRPIIVQQERTGVLIADSVPRLSRGKRMGVLTRAFGGYSERIERGQPALLEFVAKETRAFRF